MCLWFSIKIDTQLFFFFQWCLCSETFEQRLGVRLINTSCRWIVEMNVKWCRIGSTVWISMGLHAIWRCVWYDASGKMIGSFWKIKKKHFWQKNYCSLQETNIADRRGRELWLLFSGAALHHVPTWATSSRLHEGERWRCAESLMMLSTMPIYLRLLNVDERMVGRLR